MVSTSFWCERCRSDLDLFAVMKDNGRARWFYARCPHCGSGLMRYVDEKHKDPYYRKSVKIRKEREKHRKDMLQPGDAGFQTLYPESYAQLHKAEEMWYNKAVARKKSQEEFYKKYKHDVNQRELVKKAIAIEDNMVYGG